LTVFRYRELHAAADLVYLACRPTQYSIDLVCTTRQIIARIVPRLYRPFDDGTA